MAALDAKPKNVLTASFSAKFSTKGEVWRFLSTEARIYIPPYPTITIWHLKDLASGKKKVGYGFPSHLIVDSLGNPMRQRQGHLCSII